LGERLRLFVTQAEIVHTDATMKAMMERLEALPEDKRERVEALLGDIRRILDGA